MEKISLATLFAEPKFPIVEDMHGVVYQLARFSDQKRELTNKVKNLKYALETAMEDLKYAEEAFEHYSALFAEFREKGDSDGTDA